MGINDAVELRISDFTGLTQDRETFGLRERSLCLPLLQRSPDTHVLCVFVSGLLLVFKGFKSCQRFGGGSIFIKVRCTGYIAAGLGFRESVIELPEGSTVQDLLKKLSPPVSFSWIAVSINGKIKDKKTVLNENDQVLVLPLGGGG